MVIARKRKTLNDSLRRKIYERDNHTCQICGRETRFFYSSYNSPFGRNKDTIAGSVDHIVPISKGGSDGESNLRWTCKSCNCSRGNRE